VSSIAIGCGNVANGPNAAANAIAIGCGSQTGTRAVCVGELSRAPQDGIAIGYNAVSSGGNFNNIAIGANTLASGPNNILSPSIAIGFNTTTASDCVAVGSYATGGSGSSAALGCRAVSGAAGTSLGFLSTTSIYNSGDASGFQSAVGMLAAPVDTDHTFALSTNSSAVLGGALNVSVQSSQSRTTTFSSINTHNNRGFQLPLYPTLEQKNYITAPITATIDATFMPQAYVASAGVYCTFTATIAGAGPVYTVTLTSNTGGNGLFIIGMNIGTTTGTVALVITALTSGTLGLTGSTYNATVIPGAATPALGAQSLRGCTIVLNDRPYGKFTIGMALSGSNFFGDVIPSMIVSRFSPNFTGANYTGGIVATLPVTGFAFDAGNYFAGGSGVSIYGMPSLTIASSTVPTITGSNSLVGMALIGEGITPGTTISQSTIGVDLVANSTYTMRSQASATVTQTSGTTLQTTITGTFSGYISNNFNGSGSPGTQLSVISNNIRLLAGTPVTGQGVVNGTIITSCLHATATTGVINGCNLSVSGTIIGRFEPGMLVTGAGVPPNTYILKYALNDGGIAAFGGNGNSAIYVLSKGLTVSTSIIGGVTGSLYYVNKSQLVPRAVITNATSGVNPTIFTSANTFVPGQNIEVYGASGMYNGIYQVSAATSTTFSVAVLITGPFVATGYAASVLNIHASSTCGFKSSGNVQVYERSYPYGSITGTQFTGTFENIAANSIGLSAVPNTNAVSALPIAALKTFAVTATSGDGLIQTYTTAGSTFLPGELVTVTGAGAYNVSSAVMVNATATSFSVLGSVIAATTTGTATVAANNTMYVQSILGFPSSGNLQISNKETVAYTSTSAGSISIICSGAFVVDDISLTTGYIVGTTSTVQLSYGQRVSFVTNPTTTVAGGIVITGTFNLAVASVHNFPTVGTISVPTTVSSPQLVSYTGLSGGLFTGCTLNGGGSFTTAVGTVSASFSAPGNMILNSNPGTDIRISYLGTYPDYSSSTYTVTIDRPSFALSSFPSTLTVNDMVGLVRSYTAYPSICDTDTNSTSNVQYFEGGAGAPFNYNVVMPTPLLRGPGQNGHDSLLYYAPGVAAGFNVKVINRATNATINVLDGSSLTPLVSVAAGSSTTSQCVSTSTAPFWDVD
jgi:hypothetical protein